MKKTTTTQQYENSKKTYLETRKKIINERMELLFKTIQAKMEQRVPDNLSLLDFSDETLFRLIADNAHLCADNEMATRNNNRLYEWRI